MGIVRKWHGRILEAKMVSLTMVILSISMEDEWEISKRKRNKVNPSNGIMILKEQACEIWRRKKKIVLQHFYFFILVIFYCNTWSFLDTQATFLQSK